MKNTSERQGYGHVAEGQETNSEEYCILCKLFTQMKSIWSSVAAANVPVSHKSQKKYFTWGGSGKWILDFDCSFIEKKEGIVQS